MVSRLGVPIKPSMVEVPPTTYFRGPLGGRYALRHPVIVVSGLEVVPPDQDGLSRAHLTLGVPDRDTGHPIELVLSAEFFSRDEEHFVHAVKRLIVDAIAHEVEELLLHDGRRRDPHLVEVRRG